MVAVVVGGTGLVGSILVRKLLMDPEFDQVMLVTRRPTGIRNGKLKEFLVKSLSELPTLRDKLYGQVYFCCLGTTMKDAGSQDEFRKVDFKAVVDFGEIAHYHAAKALIVVSAAGARANAVSFYSHVKGEAELSLQNLGCRRLVILRPGLLIGSRVANRPLEKFFVEAFKVVESFLPMKFARKIATKADAVAQRMWIESKGDKRGVAFLESNEI